MKSLAKHFQENHQYYFWLFCIGFLCVLGAHGYAVADPTTGDILSGSGMDQTVEKTFGPGSTLMKIVYAAELFLGIIAYMKSKNPLVLIGIPVILIASAGLSTLIQ